MTMKFAGKAFVITGGGEGIGAATAQYFARRGAHVGLIGRTRKNIEEVATVISEAGGSAQAFEADIRDVEAMERAIKEVSDQRGGLDGVFANAGVNGKWASLDELSPDEFAKTVSINLEGTYTTLYVANRYLNDGAWITITSSINGTRVFTNVGAKAYAATKSAQVTLMKMLALELAARHVRVNAICPGRIASNISDNTERVGDGGKPPVEYTEGRIPLTGNRAGTPEQVAELVGFLASEGASHLTGAEIHLDGAQSLLMG